MGDEMANQFTPGPWIVRQRTSNLGVPNGRFAILSAAQSTREEFFICEMPFAAVRGDDGQESRANSHLIAAAPDMLVALEGILRCSSIDDSWLEPVRVAVTKAKNDANTSVA